MGNITECQPARLSTSTVLAITDGEMQAKVLAEIHSILAKTPVGSRKERCAWIGNNGTEFEELKVLLEGASNLTIGELTLRGHRCATQEFDRRLKKGEEFPLQYILFRGMSLNDPNFSGLYKILQAWISLGIACRAPSAPRSEVVAVISQYVWQLGFLPFIEEILSYRADWDNIRSDLNNKAEQLDNPNDFRQAVKFDERCRNARVMKSQRERPFRGTLAFEDGVGWITNGNNTSASSPDSTVSK